MHLSSAVQRRLASATGLTRTCRATALALVAVLLGAVTALRCGFSRAGEANLDRRRRGRDDEGLLRALSPEYLVDQLFEKSPDGVSVVGRDYRYQRVNPVYERFWKMPREEIVGMRVADLLGARTFEETVKPQLDRCFAGEEVSYGEWFADGPEQRYMAVSYSPLRSGSSRVEGALVISRNVTQHLMAEEALREAQAELAYVTRVSMLGEITASIAHEVNQPLAAVVMSASACRRWLEADPPNVDEARRAVQRIVDDGRRASEVIRRVRGLLQRQLPEKGPVALDVLVRETLALTRAELARQMVTVRTDLPPAPPIIGDRISLQQVLVNLILNAVDAMSDLEAGSRVLVIRLRNDPPHLMLEVEDRGKGIEPEDTRRIFQPFYSTKPGGLGLGLSISRSIVEMHGGDLWATPNSGAGATFHVRLPVAAEVEP